MEVLSIVSDLNKRLFENNRAMEARIRTLEGEVRDQGAVIDRLNLRITQLELSSAGGTVGGGIGGASTPFLPAAKRQRLETVAAVPKPWNGSNWGTMGTKKLSEVQEPFLHGNDPLQHEEMRSRVLDLLSSRGCDQQCIDYYERETWTWAHFLPMLEDQSIPARKDNESSFWTSVMRKYIQEVADTGADPILEQRIVSALDARDIDADCKDFFLKHPVGWHEALPFLEDMSQPPHREGQSAFWVSKYKSILLSKGVQLAKPKNKGVKAGVDLA
ncbi:unnamed protein product [Amoebophrya sp. A25]|nr:unnamed protein product [Amoebophrya sp. A25]|eukprot:GSA25T00019002001.1